MILLEPTPNLVVAALLALWLAVAAVALVAGIRRSRAARDAMRDVERMNALLAQSPARPLLVDAEGRLSGDTRLAGWFGLVDFPALIDEFLSMDALFSTEDAAGLAGDIAAAERLGQGFRRSLRVRGASRMLMIHGERADPCLAPGGVLLWVHDASDSVSALARLEQAERALQHRVEALSALIEAAPFPMWHRGPGLDLVMVNPAYARAVDARDPDDAIARGLELTEAGSGEDAQTAAARARESGRIATRTVPATIAGARRTIRVVDVPLGAAGVAGYALDVEELEEARADLNRFSRAQRDLLDRLSAGVAQFGPDQGLTFFNLPFLRMFGLNPDWLSDRPEFDRVLERMRETQHLPEVRDFPRWKAEHRGWFALGDAAVEEAWQLPGGFHLRVVAQPLPDGGLLLIFEDRTEELQLASARDTLLRVRAATLDNLFEAICAFAADGRIQTWNNRFRELWDVEEEVLAEHPRIDAFVDMVAPRLASPSRAPVIRELVRVATVERRQRSERLQFADGRWFEVAAVPLPDGNALFTLLDVTASRRIESALRDRNEALEEADRIKNDFVANMSYELRVPLTSIAGFAEMLAGGYAGKLEPAAQDYVEAILASVARLGKVVEDVLDLTQSEAGSLPLAQEPVDLAELVGRVAAEAQVAAEAKGQAFDLVLDPSVGSIRGDERRLVQALDHLLRNAVLYTGEGGQIRLEARGDEARAEIVISDNGPGISSREQERLFDRFGRISRKAVEGEGPSASGIGLPLARQLVEGHGGTLALSSEPGRGTAITIRLPRRAPGEGAA